jgi:hypothetical protein
MDVDGDGPGAVAPARLKEFENAPSLTTRRVPPPID